MGARFLDGPAAGLEITVRRAPTYLRVVAGGVKGTAWRGECWDVLDLPEDEPEAGERLYAYRIMPGTWGQVFVRPGGEFQSGDYYLLEVSDELLEAFRVREQFRAWAVLDHARQVSGRALSAHAAADLARMTVHAFRAAALEVGAQTDGSDVWRLPDA